MGIQGSKNVLTKQQRIAEIARNRRGTSFTSLNHFLTKDWLVEAYRKTRKDGASGIDGETGVTYKENLEENLETLLERAKSGQYRAPPVKRIHIPKGDKKEGTRPISIPTFEDKVLQRAVLMLLEPIYEQDFLQHSYGFRPGKSPHDALEALRNATMLLGKSGCAIEGDISRYFDNINRNKLMEFLKRRISDGVILRLIRKWLNAGIMEAGSLYYEDKGTVQGGVISPLLSNVYLHYTLDKWLAEEIAPQFRAPVINIRFADDFVTVCPHPSIARKIHTAMIKRFQENDLILHPDKTKLTLFARPTVQPKVQRICGSWPGTIDFLGFTLFWGTSRQDKWIVRRKTSRVRLRRSIKKISEWCRTHRHLPIAAQQEILNQKLKGHYAYFGVTGNARSLQVFRDKVQRIWRKWLSRRSQKARMNWDTFSRLLKRYPLAPVRVVHSIYTADSKTSV
jgi:RNA-directed DNA polymerase